VWAWLAILLLLAGPLVAPSAQAQGALVYFDSGASYLFSQELFFWAEVETDAPVVEAILFYGREGTRLVRRIYPELTPGARTRVEHTELLDPGQYAPGSRLRYWWRLVLASGAEVDTPQQSLLYTDDAQNWQVLSGGRVDLHWYGARSTQAQTLLQLANEALARIEQEIGIAGEQRIQVYVYASERDMRAALATRSDDYDARVTTLGVVVAEDTLVLLGSHRDVERTLAHELSHIVVGFATDNPYAGLPRWLDEGLAMYAERDLPPGNARALEQAIRDDTLLSVRSMSSYSGRADEVDLFYGASHSVVSYLLESYGQDKMRELLQVFRLGTHQETALRQVYGFGLEELDALWRASLGLAPRTLPGEAWFPWRAPLGSHAHPTPLAARAVARGWR
jgi:hypothetical protein